MDSRQAMAMLYAIQCTASATERVVLESTITYVRAGMRHCSH